MNLKNFQILILRNGYQVIQGIVSPPEFSMLGGIIDTFKTVSELEWFKSEVLKAQNKGIREYAGLNTFECFVTVDICELSHEFDKENVQVIPTDMVLEYIDECVEFLNLYNSGGVPGIIPESKKEEWMIVPKEFVNEEFYNRES